MKKLAAIGALGLLASCLFAQGLSVPSGQTKDDWEEINFEFNSSILSDGYPSLLRLAELLGQHPDFKVKITGNTDYVGSARYNDKLALARAEAVKAFLVKYGASDGQISTSGNGKNDPEVNDRTKEGRLMNRRVVLSVTDGQGRVVKEGGINDVLKALNNIQDMLQKQADCCAQILKRLDKLDDILSALNALKGENDQLKSELADQRNQLNALKDQVNGLPKPLTQQQTQTIAHTEAIGAVDEAQRRNKKFSLVGLSIGPTFGPSRTGDFTLDGQGQFFSPFGGDGTHAVQAEGEYMYYPGHQEGQFDIGLVNRWNNVQAGAFASFKVMTFKGDQNPGTLGQAAFMLDYVFDRGRIGVFGTQGFKNRAVLNSVTLAPGAFLQTYAQIVNQYGISALYGVWGNAYIQGNIGYLRRQIAGSSTPGGELKLVQPLNEHVAFTAEADYNQTLITPHNSGQVTFGLEVGNYLHPKEYHQTKSPVPMDVPRIRYELGLRRVGSSPPIADAGPNQTVSAGTVTLNGSGSYDPLGEALTFQWTQIAGPTVTLANPTAATTTFAATSGQTYTFRLTVKNTDGLTGTANTTVIANSANSLQITQFYANPANVAPGQSTTLIWVTKNASTVSISPTVGTVNPSGSASVSPTQTTTYTMTATDANGKQVTQSVTVQVGATGAVQVLRFTASPTSISPGGQSTLSWSTNGASTVTITPNVGTVTANGSTTVSPTATTTYTLTATAANGQSVTAPVTVTVGGSAGAQVQVLSFTANPPNSAAAGAPVVLSWQTSNATQVVIVGGDLAPQTLQPNGSITINPVSNQTYTLTAYGSGGQTVSTTIWVFVR